MSGLRLAVASAVARLAGLILRIGGSGGTSAPGKILLALAPAAISERSAKLERGCVVISATNGKTTTSAIVAEIMRADRATLVHNRAGANMAGGIAATLNDQRGDFGLFEVDEFWLPSLVEQLAPRSVLLANLFRDQLDRYGGVGSGSAQHASEQACCPICGAQFSYSVYFVGHLGHYSCPQGHFERPTPLVSASKIELSGLHGSSFTLSIGSEHFAAQLAMPGLYNVYNAVAAAALAFSIGVDNDTILAGIGSASPAFGRAESLQIDGRECSILLIKNPAGTNEVLRTLASDHASHDLLLVLNDRIADGRDISWIWDADFEQIVSSDGLIVCSGNRSVELALRLKYAGLAEDRISVHPELADALSAALGGSANRLVILPTYTAMLEVRELLVARGAAAESFA